MTRKERLPERKAGKSVFNALNFYFWAMTAKSGSKAAFVFDDKTIEVSVVEVIK